MNVTYIISVRDAKSRAMIDEIVEPDLSMAELIAQDAMVEYQDDPVEVDIYQLRDYGDRVVMTRNFR